MDILCRCVSFVVGLYVFIFTTKGLSAAFFKKSKLVPAILGLLLVGGFVLSLAASGITASTKMVSKSDVQYHVSGDTNLDVVYCEADGGVYHASSICGVLRHLKKYELNDDRLISVYSYEAVTKGLIPCPECVRPSVNAEIGNIDLYSIETKLSDLSDAVDDITDYVVDMYYGL